MPPQQYMWVKEGRELVTEARDALNDMLANKRGTIRKDRLRLADIFHDIARVLEKKTIKDTAFEPDA